VSFCHVAIIGAGPYGLSLAAHVGAIGCEYRIFGAPMGSWLTQMPEQMFLKSESWASNLSDPAGYATLKRFAAERNLGYQAEGRPVPIAEFIEYGQWFQQLFVPNVETETVVSVLREPDRFVLELSSGERLTAGRVVVAVGLTSFARTPAELAVLPSGFVSHSSQHRSFEQFKGRHVTVIGGGQSALESAALLHEAGADVRVVSRHLVKWPPEPVQERPLGTRLVHPNSGLGVGWRRFAACHFPGAFRRVPAVARREIVQRAQGPAGSWWLRERFVGRVPAFPETVVSSAEVIGDRIRLRLSALSGPAEDIVTQHVLAATGYQVDVDALPFLPPSLRAAIARNGKAPHLNSKFESSIQGLYFTGAAAANTFGPALRFVYGSDFASRRLARAISKCAEQLQNSPDTSSGGTSLNSAARSRLSSGNARTAAFSDSEDAR
jgi:hypothetical protein